MYEKLDGIYMRGVQVGGRAVGGSIPLSFDPFVESQLMSNGAKRGGSTFNECLEGQSCAPVEALENLGMVFVE